MRRESIKSLTLSQKKKLNFRAATLKKVVQSFDEASKSIKASEGSKSKASQNKGQDESSSSGDFNIWGDNKDSESD